MFVWIVLKNGQIGELSVFGNEAVAFHYYNSIIRKWPLTEIIKKEVKSF